jgi:hypothetical protein
MEFVKQLFSLKTDAIQIDIQLGWDKEALTLDGYDAGKTVEQLKGKLDYEYQITVKDAGLEKLYSLNGIPIGQKLQLVEAIAKKINGDKAYTQFRQYLSDNAIKFDTYVD